MRVVKRQPPLEQHQTKKWDGFLREASAGDLVPDAAIWSKLPLDLQLKLLEHLPLPALVRFQLVCKEWCRGVRNIDQVTAHGHCYVAYADRRDEWRVIVYSSRHRQTLELTQPHFLNHVCSTSDGLLYFDDLEEKEMCLYNIFTRESVPIPWDPVRDPMMIPDILEVVNIVGTYRVREHVIVRILRDEDKTIMVVFKTGRGSWETCHLQLPFGEKVSAPPYVLSHATIDNSILYFVTVNLRTRAMSVRWIDLRQDLDGTSTKLVSFPSLQSRYTMFVPEHIHVPVCNPDGLLFTGNIAVAGARLFMGCMRVLDPAEPRFCTVALFSCDKQEKRWEFVGEMPMTKGFVAWQPDQCHCMELWSQGDKLVVFNRTGESACIYNTSTQAWSPFPDTNVLGVCPFKLSMRV